MPLDPEDRKWFEEQFREVHTRIDTAFTGPEGEPHKGVWVRLDRVEQMARAIGRIAWLAVSAGVAGIIGAFSSHGGSTPPGSHP